MADIAFFVGALVPTFLISRLGLWLTRQWNGGSTRLLFIHGMTLLAIAFVGGMGMADGGAFAGARALLSYAPAQALWLIVDLVRAANRRMPPAEDVGAGRLRAEALWFAGAVAVVAIAAFAVNSMRSPQPRYSWEQAPQAEEFVAPVEAPAGAFDDLIAPAEAPADPAPAEAPVE